MEDAEISIFKDLAVQPVDSSVLAVSVESICILIVFSYPITPPTQKHI